MAHIYVICSHPARRTGMDRVERCCAFIDRRTFRLPFEVSAQPTAAMLRNNCYGVEAPEQEDWLLDHLLEIQWGDYVRGSVNSSYNLNKRALALVLEDAGIQVEPAPRTGPPPVLFK